VLYIARAAVDGNLKYCVSQQQGNVYYNSVFPM